MTRPTSDDPDRFLGLYPKFEVHRTDPEAEVRHEGHAYFVLDLTDDAFAGPALRAYADACRDEYPVLASDLYRLLDGGIVANLKEGTTNS